MSLVYKVHKVNTLIIRKLCYFSKVYYNIDNQLFIFANLKCLYFLDWTH